MHSTIKLLPIFIVLLLSLGIVLGAECGVSPIDGCTVSASTQFAQTTYYFNGSAIGAIQPAASDITIDCNGSRFVGNYTAEPTSVYYFAKSNTYNNVTFKNCFIDNYYNGIAFRSAENDSKVINCSFNNTYQAVDIMTGKQILIANSTFYKTTQYGIYLEANSNLWYNATIINNVFNAETNRKIYATGHATNIAKGLNIIGNTLYNGTGSVAPIYVDSVKYVNISNNIVDSNVGAAVLSSNGVYILRSSNIYIGGNNINRYDGGLTISTLARQLNASNLWECDMSTNIVIENNLLRNNDRGMRVRGTYDTLIQNNVFYNNTDGVDAYDVDLYFEECNKNIVVTNNNFSGIGSTGIFAEAIDGLKITNNLFNMLSLSEKQALYVNDIYDFPTPIAIVELYKSFAQANRTGQPANYNLTFINTLRSNNITITGNSFDGDTRTYMILQATTNVISDISDFWYKKFSPLVYLEDAVEYYNSKNYDRLYWTNSLGSIKDLTYYGYGNTTAVYILMASNFTKTWEYFKNINITQTIARYNLTNALMFYGNNTLICKACNNNINVSMAYLDELLIFDNFVATQDTIQYSPITVTDLSDTRKRITNALDINVSYPVIVNVDCDHTVSGTYTSDSGSTDAFTRDYIREHCSSGRLCLGTLFIDPATNNNILTFELNTTDFSNTILRIVIGLIALLVLGIAVAGVMVYVVRKVSLGDLELEVGGIITLGVTLLVCIVLAGALIDYIYALL